MNKIRIVSSKGMAFMSLIVPGSTQIMTGRTVRGFVMLGLAILLIPTVIGTIIVAMYSSWDAEKKSAYKCPKCMSFVAESATICKHCHTDLSEA